MYSQSLKILLVIFAAVPAKTSNSLSLSQGETEHSPFVMGLLLHSEHISTGAEHVVRLPFKDPTPVPIPRAQGGLSLNITNLSGIDPVLGRQPDGEIVTHSRSVLNPSVLPLVAIQFSTVTGYCELLASPVKKWR